MNKVINKQRILIFIDWFAPGFKAGGPTTSNVNIVEHLKDKFDFYVMTTDTDYHEFQPYQNVVSDKWIKQNGFSVYHFSLGNLSFKALKKAVKEAACDTWYVNGIYSKYFSIYPLILAKMIHPRQVIVSARGMLSPHALAIKSIVKKSYLVIARGLRFFDKVKFHATNEEEADYIRLALGKNRMIDSVENLPRKVNLNSFATRKDSTEIKLVSFARISPEKNTLYAIECLKYCKERVVYHIYGQINSMSYWKECEKVIKILPDHVTVEYKGTVSPQEMSNIYKGYHFLYLPSTGENFGHAILESLMNSTPVIISDKTPWRCLVEKHVGWDLPLEDKQLFASTIDKCARLSWEQYKVMVNKACLYAKEVSENPCVVQSYINLFTK